MGREIKIMKNKPDISDEEIQTFMDFEILLDKQRTQARQRFLVKRAIITITTLSLFAIVFWWSRPVSIKPLEQAEETAQQVQQPKAADTLVTKDSSIHMKPSPMPLKNKELSQQDPLKTISSQKTADKPEVNPTLPNDKIERTEEHTDTEYLYKQAEPVAGYPALYEYFRKELTYPPSALADSIQGVVTVFFTIQENGNVSGVRIENSLGSLFDDEVLRLIHGMPKWKPATVNNRPVASTMSLPFTFQYKTLPASK